MSFYKPSQILKPDQERKIYTCDTFNFGVHFKKNAAWKFTHDKQNFLGYIFFNLESQKPCIEGHNFFCLLEPSNSKNKTSQIVCKKYMKYNHYFVKNVWIWSKASYFLIL